MLEIFVLFVDQIKEKLDQINNKLDKVIGESDSIDTIERLARTCLQ